MNPLDTTVSPRNCGEASTKVLNVSKIQKCAGLVLRRLLKRTNLTA